MKTQTSALVASLFALFSFGCNQEPGDVEVLLEDKIQGEDGKDIAFAIFGAAEQNGVVSMIVVASDNEDLCGEIGADVDLFIQNAKEGQFANQFVITTVLAQGQLADGVTLQGDQQNGEAVNPEFIVGNGADPLVDAVDQDEEGELTIDAFNGDTLAATISANLNQEISGIINDNINVGLDVNVLNATECGVLTTFAQGQL